MGLRVKLIDTHRYLERLFSSLKKKSPVSLDIIKKSKKYPELRTLQNYLTTIKF